VDNTDFQNNSAKLGSCINVIGASILVRSSSFYSNNALQYGGGVLFTNNRKNNLD
jgi:hypothetical protein